MGPTGWVLTLAGIWVAASVALGLLVGPLLRRHSSLYPLPAEEHDQDQPRR